MDTPDPKTSAVDDAFAAPWVERAKKFGYSPMATFNDDLQFEMEVTALAGALKETGERIFDVGCGNGATHKLLQERGIVPEAFGGCELLQEFVDLAKTSMPNGTFFHMDINDDASAGWQAIAEFKPTAIIFKRVLCNLAGRRPVRRVLSHLCSVIPPGCRIILIEPILDGLMGLNALRHSLGLPFINEPPFNEYLRWGDLQSTFEISGCTAIQKYDYTSTYYLGSRVLQPFLWKDQPVDYMHPINVAFRDMPNREGFGIHWIIQATKA